MLRLSFQNTRKLNLSEYKHTMRRIPVQSQCMLQCILQTEGQFFILYLQRTVSLHFPTRVLVLVAWICQSSIVYIFACRARQRHTNLQTLAWWESIDAVVDSFRFSSWPRRFLSLSVHCSSASPLACWMEPKVGTDSNDDDEHFRNLLN